MTSLVFGGKQFLSNEPGWAGGTTITGGLAPRNLADVREPGPGCLSCSDNDVSVVMEFGERRVDWTVTNRSKDEIRYRIALHPKVAVRRRGEAEPVEFRRDAATALVTGVDLVSESDSGYVLETILKGQSSRRLSLSIGGK